MKVNNISDDAPNTSGHTDGLAEQQHGVSLFTSRQIAHGGIWTLIGFGGAQVVSLCSSLVLTRLLDESVYGVMALVWSLITALHLFSDVGIGFVLTQNPRGEERGFRRTAWTIQVVRGFALWFVALAISPLVAGFYPEYAGLQPLLIATCLSSVIGGFTSTSWFMASRNMNLRALASLELATQVLSTAVVAVHAWIAPSPWAMVSGALANVAAKTLASHLFLGGGDGFGWDREAARELFHFGRWVFVSTFLTFFVMQADRLIFGKMIPPASLGVYSVALGLSMAASQLMSRLVGGVLYPIYCRFNNNGNGLGEAFDKYRAPVMLLGGWMLSGGIGGGDAAMRLLYTKGFSDAGWILQLLCMGAWFSQGLESPRSQALLAIGKPRLSAAAGFTKVVGMAVLIPLGGYLRGFPGALAGYVLTEVPRYLVTLWNSYRSGMLGFSRDLGYTSWVAVVSTLVFWCDEYLAVAGTRPSIRCLTVFAVSTIMWSPLAWPLVRQVRSIMADHRKSASGEAAVPGP